MEPVGRGVCLGHHLDAELPPGIVAVLDALIEVALVALPVLGDDRRGLFVGEVPDALLAHPVELDPVSFPGRVYEAVGVAAEAVQVAVA